MVNKESYFSPCMLEEEIEKEKKCGEVGVGCRFHYDAVVSGSCVAMLL